MRGVHAHDGIAVRRAQQLERTQSHFQRAHIERATERAREIRCALEAETECDIGDLQVRKPREFIGCFAQTAMSNVRAETAFLLEPSIDGRALQTECIDDLHRREIGFMKMRLDITLHLAFHGRLQRGA